MSYLIENILEEKLSLDVPNGIFVKVIPTADCQADILDYFDDLSINDDIVLCDDLHCTLLYSKDSKTNVKIPYISKDDRFTAKAKELVYWPGHDDTGYIVLKLKSKDLQELNQKFRTSTGLKATFPDYQPHITLIHPVPNKEDLEEIVNEINKEIDLEIDFYYGGYSLLEKDKMD